MKRILLILLLTLSMSSFAQDKEKQERVKALKIAFITERLQFTEIEAQKFWPIYNAYNSESQRLRKKTLGKFKKGNFELMGNQEAKALLEEMMATDKKKHELKQQFIKDLLKILPAKKIISLKATENAFNRRMMQEMKKRRDGFRKNHP